MKDRLTPAHLEMIIRLNSGQTIWPSMNAPILNSFPQDLMELGYIVPRSDSEDSNRYKITDKGRAFLAVLCRTQPPRQTWVSAEGIPIAP